VLASASEDGRCSCWSPRTGELLRSWQFDDHVRCLAFAGDATLCCGGYDGEVRALSLAATGTAGAAAAA
ncbi:MAG TPA: hypothetical protein VN253_00100, partial [Kofleriaceae bacterium]|nr:hypothetical protein [Kofleriaceae bacterium]